MFWEIERYWLEGKKIQWQVKAVVKKNVLVGIQMDSHSRELLSWALVKVADPGDCVVAVHVCRCSGNALWKILYLYSNMILICICFLNSNIYQHRSGFKKQELVGWLFRSLWRPISVKKVSNASSFTFFSFIAVSMVDYHLAYSISGWSQRSDIHRKSSKKGSGERGKQFAMLVLSLEVANTLRRVV
jgi:hypothetical protein